MVFVVAELVVVDICLREQTQVQLAGQANLLHFYSLSQMDNSSGRFRIAGITKGCLDFFVDFIFNRGRSGGIEGGGQVSWGLSWGRELRGWTGWRVHCCCCCCFWWWASAAPQFSCNHCHCQCQGLPGHSTTQHLLSCRVFTSKQASPFQTKIGRKSVWITIKNFETKCAKSWNILNFVTKLYFCNRKYDIYLRFEKVQNLRLSSAHWAQIIAQCTSWQKNLLAEPIKLCIIGVCWCWGVDVLDDLRVWAQLILHINCSHRSAQLLLIKVSLLQDFPSNHMGTLFWNWTSLFFSGEKMAFSVLRNYSYTTKSLSREAGGLVK